MNEKEMRRRGLAWKGDGVKPKMTRQMLRQLVREHPGTTYNELREAARIDGLLPENSKGARYQLIDL